MKLDFSSDNSVISLIEDDFAQTSSTETTQTLRAGIKAAQRGDRAEARQLLLRVTETDPNNESAWLWLASISEYPEELLIFLNNVLDINPENERALEWAKATKSLLAKTFVQRGIEANNQDQKQFARQCFMQAIVHDNRNEMAWLWLASVTDSSEEKIAHFHRVLEINPENEKAREAIGKAKKERVQAFFEKANDAANTGHREQAKEFLAKVLNQNPYHENAWILRSRLTDSFEEKIACFEKILEFNPDNETAQAGVKLRAMLNGSAPKEEEAEELSFPHEEVAEQLASAENSYFAEAEENFGENREFENERFAAEDEPAVSSFENEMVSASDETQQFSYFAADNEQAEMSETESSAEKTDEYNFENESAVEDDKEYFSSEAEKPEEFFVEYPKDYSGEDFASNEASSSDVYEFKSAETFETSETSENGFHAEATETRDSAEEDKTAKTEVFDKPYGELTACPFCNENNEAQAFVCRSCRSLLTLSDMEMILAYSEADEEILKEAVERMEVKEIQRGLEADELVMLAIGHINLKNLRKGLEYLQKAAKLDPNNVVVESQANSLAIRLAEIEEKENVQSSMPKDRTIMVVDDSATVRKLISGKLEKCGHFVITAVDGMDAMAKLNEVVPDLILLDITMPRMDGYQVCKLIRNNDITKDIPVVMISGKDGFFDKVRGRMAGTTGYITKPFGPETLMKMLDTYLV